MITRRKPATVRLTLTLTEPQLSAWSAAAKAHEISLEEWIAACGDASAEEQAQSQADSMSRRRRIEIQSRPERVTPIGKLATIIARDLERLRLGRPPIRRDVRGGGPGLPRTLKHADGCDRRHVDHPGPCAILVQRPTRKRGQR